MARLLPQKFPFILKLNRITRTKEKKIMLKKSFDCLNILVTQIKTRAYIFPQKYLSPEYFILLSLVTKQIYKIYWFKFWKHHADPQAGTDMSSFLFCLSLPVKFNQTWKKKKGTSNVIP